MKPEWQPILDAACKIIIEVMEAGQQQREREGKPTDEWMKLDPKIRLHHAFMHLVSCKTYEGNTGEPWVLAENTRLEEYKHALCGLAIVGAHDMGLLDTPEPVVVDSTMDDVKGE